MQIHEQLSVGKAVRQLVGQMHRQSSLAHPGHAGDGRDDHRSPFGSVTCHDATKPSQLRLPPGEIGDVAGKLMKSREGSPPDRGRAVEAILAVELQECQLMDGDEAPPSHTQLRLVGFDDIEGGEAMSTLVLDQVAVGAVEPPRQAPE